MQQQVKQGQRVFKLDTEVRELQAKISNAQAQRRNMGYALQRLDELVRMPACTSLALLHLLWLEHG